ncbi:MAG: Gfo/Idh/MocA family oxidoreductase [Verrucomicrobiae bacterium]|nr:Gfo/Idh/MocA family oxidoreductase [Verrucomicrobiae bacterium]
MNLMSRGGRISRRRFLRCAAFASAFLIVPSRVLGRFAPSNRIHIGIIGCGNHGEVDTRGFLVEPDTQVLAVCDVNRSSYGYKTEDQFLGREPMRRIVEEYYAQQRRSGNYRGCDAYTDFREVLARPDIDAVAIVVPDHWHATMAILAARAGKDIYCEKPLSLTVSEGRAMVEAVRRYGVVLQTGSHHRSSPRTRHMCELVRNGRIGRVKRVVAYVPGWNKTAPAGAWEPMPVPEGFDYDFWLGPAPWEPYHKDRCLYNFRFILDYSGGQVTNFGAHCLDLVQWALGRQYSGPVEVEDAGSEWPKDGLFNVASKVHFRARYADGVELECVQSEERLACRFEGTEGWMQFNYGGTNFSSNIPGLQNSVIGPGEVRLGDSANHFRDFLDCVRMRRDPIAPVEAGHYSATLCHIGNIAMMLKRRLRWDPKAERFIGDDEANRMLSRAYRSGWAWI